MFKFLYILPAKKEKKFSRAIVEYFLPEKLP